MTEKELREKAILMIKQDFDDPMIWFPKAFGSKFNYRQDIFGCFDLIVCTKMGEIFLIQLSTISHKAAKIRKIKEQFCTETVFDNAYVFLFNKAKEIWFIKRVNLIS